MKEPVIDGTMIMKFFFTALNKNRTKSITLPMSEVRNVPDGFGELLKIQYYPELDKLEIGIKTSDIIIPRIHVN